MLVDADVSYAFEQTAAKDINAAYNDKEFLQKKIQDFYEWCTYTAKNDFWYKIESTQHLKTIISTIDQAQNDVFGIEINTEKTDFRIIDLKL